MDALHDSAAELRKAEPHLTAEQSFAKVYRLNPELARRERAAARGGDSMTESGATLWRRLMVSPVFLRPAVVHLSLYGVTWAAWFPRPCRPFFQFARGAT